MKLLIINFLIISLNLFAQDYPTVFVLDDAERPKMSRWKILGPVSPDIGVDYISSDKERKNVIRIKSDNLLNEFILKGNKGEALNIKDGKVLQWKMKFNRPFIIGVEVQTTQGIKKIVYTDMSINFRTGTEYFHIGLGSRYRDGKWRTVVRDLQADMRSLDKNIKINNILGLFFRGSGYLDDIWVLSYLPKDIVLSDGDNGLKGWDKIGKGGSISIDFDTLLGEIIKIDSGPNKASFRLRKQDSTYWDIRTNVVLQWKLKTTNDLNLYVLGTSSRGKYIISYRLGNKPTSYDKEKGIIYYYLGETIKDGVWHVFTRNLSDDLRNVMPGTDIKSVASILVDGEGYLDEIKLIAKTPIDTSAIDGWEVYDTDPAGASIEVYNDIEKGDVAQLVGDGLKNGYRYSVPKKTVQDSFISWDMWFFEPFDIMLAIDTGNIVKYVHYVPMNEDYQKIKDGELYIGIGEDKTGGKWFNITRNIKEDVKKLGYDAEFKSCKFFMVRGSGKVGPIKFSSEAITTKKEQERYAASFMVLGQYDFYRNLNNVWGIQEVLPNGLNAPFGVVPDRSGGIYVTDTANNRVVYWSKTPELYGAEYDLEFNYGGKLNSPKAVHIIEDRLLAIADSANNRVLIFRLPLNDKSVPDIEISGLKDPAGLFYDGKRFFIADTGNSRILMWNEMPKSSSKEFDLVLGQSSVTGVSPNKGKGFPNYNTMMYPTDVYSDGQSLYVADTGNNRVLVFDKIPTMNGWHADAVIGQKKFKDMFSNMGSKNIEDGLNSPTGIFIFNERMYITDHGNNRVLVLVKDSSGSWKVDGVVGQKNTNSNNINGPLMTPTPSTLFGPYKAYIRDKVIYITDKLNNRVLVY
jgi:hypothetical protein